MKRFESEYVEGMSLVELEIKEEMENENIRVWKESGVVEVEDDGMIDAEEAECILMDNPELYDFMYSMEERVRALMWDVNELGRPMPWNSNSAALWMF